MARLRLAARMVVLGPDDRTLLMKWRNEVSGSEWWATPGGGAEEGETMRDAALRELSEETGLVPTEVWGPVYDHEHFFRSRSELLHQRERFFAARVASHEVDTSGFDALERQTAVGHRWWTPAEMERSLEAIHPEEMPAIVRAALRRRDLPPGPPVRLVAGHTPRNLARSREMFTEYAASMAQEPCFRSLDDELAALPGQYGPPDGRLLLAVAGSGPVGIAALRRLDERTGEVKRVYVRPAYRGRSVGSRLTGRIVAEAISAGYSRLRLDTLPTMVAARGLYRALGFVEIPPYGDDPVPGAVHYQLDLSQLAVPPAEGESPDPSI